MSVRSVLERGSLRSFLSACLVWTIAAVLLSLAAAAVIRGFSIPSAYYGYISSIMSFAAAAAALSRVSGGMLRALLTSVGLCLLLLTLGWMIGSRPIDPSGVLNLVCFTLAGGLAGNLAAHHSAGKKKSSGTFAKKRGRKR